jgi:glycine hydroxymethyltransferase
VEAALDQVHITVNKNTIPFETRSPFVTSGIRLGTPAVTSRGLGQKEMETIAGWISRVCEALRAAPAEARVIPGDLREEIGKQVMNLCGRFPIYRG